MRRNCWGCGAIHQSELVPYTGIYPRDVLETLHHSIRRVQRLLVPDDAIAYVCPSKNKLSIDSYSVLRLVSFLSTIHLIRLLSACNISFFLISPWKDCD